MRFDEIKYERINIKEEKKKALLLIREFKAAKTFEEGKKVLDKLDELLADNIYSTVSYVHIMNTIDTSNKFYEDEVKYYNKSAIKLLGFNKKFNKDLLNNKFRSDYEKDGKSMQFKLAEVSQRQTSLKTVLLSLQESNYAWTTLRQ